ncbi:MAG: CBS domain-containing protein [Leptolyngbya sp. SIO3F4]|nr:CBS domain-containing protein [Leptolyngbya sp. SIO3F4]
MTLDKALNSVSVSMSSGGHGEAFDDEIKAAENLALEPAQDSLQTVTPMITDAIDRQVLMVSPDWSLSRAIAAMGALHSNCGLTPGSVSSRHASCALIVEAQRIIGIFTERDIVRLTANGVSLGDLTVADVMTSPVKTLQQSAFQDIFAVLFLFRRYRIRHLPIVDENNHPVGIVTPASIRRVLRPANLLKMRRVADVMSTNVIHAAPTAKVMELAQQMAENRVSCIVIVEVDRHATNKRELQAFMPMGIVTERDIVQFQALELDLRRLTAQDVMSSPLFLLQPTDSLWTAHQEMQTRRVRRLVVSWNWGSGLGIVTQTSLLRVFDPIEMYGIIESMQQTLDQIGDKSNLSQDWVPASKQQDQVTDLLFDIETKLLSLSNEDNPSTEERQKLVQGALRSLQQVQATLGG